jgi:hypothetical protein
MSSITIHPVPAKPAKPEAPLYSWTLPPVQGWGLITIRGVLYRLREIQYDESDGTPRMLVKLRKQDGTEYQLTPDQEHRLLCDCPWGSYKPVEEGCKSCKHREAVLAAYADLDRQARLAEFLDSDPEAATLRLISADGTMIDALLDAAASRCSSPPRTTR